MITMVNNFIIDANRVENVIKGGVQAFIYTRTCNHPLIRIR